MAELNVVGRLPISLEFLEIYNHLEALGDPLDLLSLDVTRILKDIQEARSLEIDLITMEISNDLSLAAVECDRSRMRATYSYIAHFIASKVESVLAQVTWKKLAMVSFSLPCTFIATFQVKPEEAKLWLATS